MTKNNEEGINQRLFFETGWDDQELAKDYKTEIQNLSEMRNNLFKILSIIAEARDNQDYLRSKDFDGKEVVGLAVRNLEGKTVLDLGCGPGGDFEREILPAVKSLIAVDKSGGMLKLLKEDEEIAKHKEKVLPVKGDVSLLPIAKNSVDVAVAAHLIHYLRSREEEDEFFSRVLSALKPGGYFIVNGVSNSANQKVKKEFGRNRNEELSVYRRNSYRLKETYRDYVILDSEIVERLKELGFDCEIEVFFNDESKSHCAVKIIKKSNES